MIYERNSVLAKLISFYAALNAELPALSMRKTDAIGEEKNVINELILHTSALIEVTEKTINNLAGKHIVGNKLLNLNIC